MTVTPVGMRCPECAKQKTKARRMTASAGAPTFAGDQPTLTYILIGINVAVWFGGALSGASTTGGGGVGSSSLLADGSVSRIAIDQGDYWRLLTAGFLHSGFLHLLFNMFALYVLGTLLEPAIGRWRFGIIFFVSLLAGSFGALLIEPDAATVGASGAVFGLMGAALVVMRNRGMNMMESGLGVWLGLNLLITFTIPGISIGGHLGGLAGGVLAALCLYEVPDRVRVPPALPLAMAVGIGVAAVVAAIAVSADAASSVVF
jgi:membrane associated rhomboid family serine protease